MAETLTAAPARLKESLFRSGVTFYGAIGLLCASIAVVGFWPSYFGRLLSGTLDILPIIHVLGRNSAFEGYL